MEKRIVKSGSVIALWNGKMWIHTAPISKPREVTGQMGNYGIFYFKVTHKGLIYKAQVDFSALESI